MAAAAVTAIAFVPRSGADDWIGDRYGWRSQGNLIWVTTDGGKTWRRMRAFSTGDLWTFAHTGPTTGVVSLGPQPTTEEAWTVDNGRHWYDAPAIGNALAIEGHGRFLYWSTFPFAEGKPRAGRLYAVRPWPPGKAQLQCRGGFSRDIGSRRCLRPTRPVRSVQVATVRDGYLSQLATAPGGIVALVERVGDDPRVAPLRVLIRRNGRNLLVTLPRISAEREARVASALMTVSYPTIIVAGYDRGPAAKVVATWRTNDGGRIWHAAES
jgi:hypothetical protein